MQSRKLGKGLDSLLGVGNVEVNDSIRVSQIPLAQIQPNRFQPRRHFDPAHLEELRNSIRCTGLLQPIVVRQNSQGFEIIAGERRFRACQLEKLETIPAIVREAEDRQLLLWALVENLHRDNLNPIEEARAYQRLSGEFALTHEKASDLVGISRAAFTNALRLLDLPDEIQHDVSRGTISMGHARALLCAGSKARQLHLSRMIVSQQLSVRALENIIKSKEKKSRASIPSVKLKCANTKDLEDKLAHAIRTRVSIIERSKSGHGSIIIDFMNFDEFDRIYHLLINSPSTTTSKN